MNYATRTRRVECANALLEKLERNLRMTERVVIQDESDFLSQIPINRTIMLTLRDKREIFLIKIFLIK